MLLLKSMRSLTTFIYNDVFHYAILTIATIYILAHYIMCTDSVVINADASYYVGVTRLIMEGNTPFVDFALSYTPLSFYLMCIPFSIWGSSFNCAIIVLYFVHVVNAFVVYLILHKTSHSKKTAWLGALLFLLYAFLFSGFLKLGNLCRRQHNVMNKSLNFRNMIESCLFGVVKFLFLSFHT